MPVVKKLAQEIVDDARRLVELEGRGNILEVDTTADGLIRDALARLDACNGVQQHVEEWEFYELLVQEKDDIVKRLAFFGVVPEPARSAPRQPRVRGF